MSGINEEDKKLYLKRVDWLRKNVALDDIYDFAEQALTCADFLIRKWNEWEDIQEEILKDTAPGKMIKNIMTLRLLHNQNYTGGISLVNTFEDIA